MQKKLYYFFVSTVTLIGPIQAKPLKWATYVNVRFGYSVCYPTNLLKPEAESDNSDGRPFRSRDGALLRVWGLNDIFKGGYKDQLEGIADDARERGMSVKNKSYNKYYGQISGKSSSKIFYGKSILNINQTNNMYFIYPRSLHVKYDRIAMHILKCFKKGNPAF